MGPRWEQCILGRGSPQREHSRKGPASPFAQPQPPREGLGSWPPRRAVASRRQRPTPPFPPRGCVISELLSVLTVTAPRTAPTDSQSGSCFEKSDCTWLGERALTAFPHCRPVFLSQARRSVSPKPHQPAGPGGPPGAAACAPGSVRPRFSGSGQCRHSLLHPVPTAHRPQGTEEKTEAPTPDGLPQSHRITPQQPGRAQAPGRAVPTCPLSQAGGRRCWDWPPG